MPSKKQSDPRQGKRYASRAGDSERKPYLAYFDEPTMSALSTTANALGLSKNLIVNEALQSYLAGPEVQQRIEERSRYQETIDKLAGGS